MQDPSQPVDAFFVCCMGALTGVFALFVSYACGSFLVGQQSPESYAERCQLSGYAEVLEEDDEENAHEDASDMSDDGSDAEATGHPKED